MFLMFLMFLALKMFTLFFHGVFHARIRGGFPRRISETDFELNSLKIESPTPSPPKPCVSWRVKPRYNFTIPPMPQILDCSNPGGGVYPSPPPSLVARAGRLLARRKRLSPPKRSQDALKTLQDAPKAFP